MAYGTVNQMAVLSMHFLSRKCSKHQKSTLACSNCASFLLKIQTWLKPKLDMSRSRSKNRAFRTSHMLKKQMSSSKGILSSSKGVLSSSKGHFSAFEQLKKRSYGVFWAAPAYVAHFLRNVFSKKKEIRLTPSSFAWKSRPSLAHFKQKLINIHLLLKRAQTVASIEQNSSNFLWN